MNFKLYIISNILILFFLSCDFNQSDMKSKNILGTELSICCTNPLTGFYRNGYCETGVNDYGTHTVCAIVTDDFLKFSLTRGNDLISKRNEYNFPGLKHGDKWCLCAIRWKEAYDNGVAPKILAESTNEKTLEIIDKKILLKMSLDLKK